MNFAHAQKFLLNYLTFSVNHKIIKQHLESSFEFAWVIYNFEDISADSAYHWIKQPP